MRRALTAVESDVWRRDAVALAERHGHHVERLVLAEFAKGMASMCEAGWRPAPQLSTGLERIPDAVHPSALDPGQVAALTVARIMLDTRPDRAGRDRPAPSAPGAVVTFPFAFPWRRRNDALGRWRRGTGEAVMERIGGDEAPVVMALRRRRGWIDVRWRDGTWLRPVLAPGSWEPMSEADFAASVAVAPAWTDNPFAPWPRRSIPAFDLFDLCGPADPTSRRSVSEEDAALGATVAAGPLTSVDGIFHVSCEAPAATVAVDGSGWVRPGWRLGPALTDRSHVGLPARLVYREETHWPGPHGVPGLVPAPVGLPLDAGFLRGTFERWGRTRETLGGGSRVKRWRDDLSPTRFGAHAEGLSRVARPDLAPDAVAQAWAACGAMLADALLAPHRAGGRGTERHAALLGLSRAMADARGLDGGADVCGDAVIHEAEGLEGCGARSEADLFLAAAARATVALAGSAAPRDPEDHELAAFA